MRCTVLLAVLTCVVFGNRPALANTGSRPRNLAVSSDGATVLVTSLGGNSVMERVGTGPITPIDVSAPTWGVCMLDDLTAVVTHPFDAKITVLERGSLSASFTETVTTHSIPYVYCTEVVPSWRDDHVLVANRGARPEAPGAEDWQHAVYEIRITDGNITNTFVTEREPSALALSPSGEYLFVGHIQGALGGPGIAPDDPEANWAFDGGSIVMFRVSDQAPVKRFAVGSPVRDVAIWPPAEYDGTESYLDGGYRLYFTHVGDGAQSEAPGLGGRAVPNVISSIQFTSADAVVADSRQDVTFRHDPAHEPAISPSGPDLPAVLPEQIAFRWDTGPDPDAWELWVTNSASGTVSRAHMDPSSGKLQVTLTPLDISAPPGESFFVVSRDPDDPDDPPAIDESPASAGNALIQLDVIDNPSYVVVSKSLATPLEAFGSNPRGILFDAAGSRLLVVTQLDHQLVEIDPVALSASGANLFATPVDTQERNFFAAGFGFDFREPESDRVNNLSCGSCHPNGHLDGKVRMTVLGDVIQGGEPRRKPVAVPSVFDVGMTEWIFLEGLITIRDAEPNSECVYCNVGFAGFFTDTREFTNSLSSPLSPHAIPSGPGQDASFDSDEQWGRAYFEDLNCHRCHAGATGTDIVFVRTEEPNRPPGVPIQGPLPDSLVDENRFFHDPGQSFLTFVDGIAKRSEIPPDTDAQSLRNMTDVGTRPPDDVRLGINTPALAGAWDNAPYLHDGRYRTLREVLDHTWVNPMWDNQAAPDPLPGMLLPDNAFNELTFSENPLPDIDDQMGALYAFDTHRHDDSSGSRTAVTSWLSDDGVDDLVAFLNALSSRTDPCADTSGQSLLITNLQHTINGDDTTSFTWSTTYPVSCTIVWGEEGSPPVTIRTPVEVSHTLDLPTSWDNKYTISINAKMPVCDLVAPTVVDEWCVDDPVTVYDISNIKLWPCVYTTLSWKTTVSTGCRVEWGLKGAGFPNEEFTPAGTQHSIQISTQTGKKYEARITPLINECEAVVYSWTQTDCIVIGKEPTPELPDFTGIQAIAPNPFNPSTEVSFALQHESPVRLVIYNLQGRLVREVHDGTLPAGIHRREWDGTSANGKPVASGVYFVDFRAGKTHQVRKLTLIE